MCDLYSIHITIRRCAESQVARQHRMLCTRSGSYMCLWSLRGGHTCVYRCLVVKRSTLQSSQLVLGDRGESQRRPTTAVDPQESTAVVCSLLCIFVSTTSHPHTCHLHVYNAHYWCVLNKVDPILVGMSVHFTLHINVSHTLSTGAIVQTCVYQRAPRGPRGCLCVNNYRFFARAELCVENTDKARRFRPWSKTPPASPNTRVPFPPPPFPFQQPPESFEERPQKGTSPLYSERTT